MNRVVKSSSAKLGAIALAVVTTLVMSSAAAATAHKSNSSASTQSRVVAHIAFSGLSTVDMAIQKTANDKFYLYVQHSNDQGISIIDITNASRSKTVAKVPWPDANVSGRLNTTGNLGIIAESQRPTARNSSANNDLVLWDISNPAAPKVVQKFSGVVKWLRDGRNFMYILNADGLWIVSEPADPQPPSVSDSYGG